MGRTSSGGDAEFTLTSAGVVGTAIDWVDQEDVTIESEVGQKTFIAVPWGEDDQSRNMHKFALRITGLPSNIYIREIKFSAAGLAQGNIAE